MLVTVVQVVGAVFLPIILLIMVVLKRQRIEELEAALRIWREDLRGAQEIAEGGRISEESRKAIEDNLEYVEDVLNGK